MSHERERLDVTAFGARGNGRSDSTDAINSAFGAAREIEGAVVHFPPGQYLVGAAPCMDTTALVLEDATDVELSGRGATLLQGPHGLRTLGIFRCRDVRVSGLRFVGDTTHAGAPYYQHSAAIAVNYGSRGVTIEECSITNYLGDCLYLGGSLEDGGGTGHEVRDVVIRRCLLKERYGDGVRVYDGGSRSRLAVAVIDAVGVRIQENVIYGTVDFEPNLDGQHVVDCRVERNAFLHGPVIPQRRIGWARYHDEPVVAGNARDAVSIDGGVSWTGVPGHPVVRDNLVGGNRFDLGTVSVQNAYVADIRGNRFRRGRILVGALAGPNYTRGVEVEENHVERLLPGDRGFIRLAGRVAESRFIGNTVADESGAVIADGGPGTGDHGRCLFRANRNLAAGNADHRVLALRPDASSVVES
jgi:hypothetical protein